MSPLSKESDRNDEIHNSEHTMEFTQNKSYISITRTKEQCKNAERLVNSMFF